MIMITPMPLFDSLKKEYGIEDLCDMAFGYKEGLDEETRKALLEEFDSLPEMHPLDSEGVWR